MLGERHWILLWFDDIVAGKPPWMVGCLVFRLILLLGRCRRESDIVARLGGGEFAVLLPDTTLAGARYYFANLHCVLESEIHQRGCSMLDISIRAAAFERKTPDLSEALQLADS